MSEELDKWIRRYEREKSARKQAEQIAEEKTREIYYINEELSKLNEHLEEMVELRTADLEKARDEAIEASKVKSQFLANMSHELRTPLNAIIGYSEMLKEDAEELEDSYFAEDLQKIHTAGKHLLSIINDILDLSKIEAGKMELYYEKVELSNVLNDIRFTVEPLAAKNNNELIIESDAGIIETDLTKLRQILLNLLGNANKFTENGTVKLTVRKVEHDGVPGHQFQVEDTGIGMTEAQMDRLFEAFTQADSSTTRKFGGTGLGLAISYRFSHMMGGLISVSSEYGQGSVFTLWIPDENVNKIEELVLDELSTEQLTAAADSMESNGKRILIIDDDPTMHSLMRRYLSHHNWQPIFAANGFDGIERAREYKPDVITLDVLMPGMDGWKVMQVLKEDPELKHIPVIILSMTDNRNLGFTLGASEYLMKPVDRKSLLGVLQKYIPEDELGESMIMVVEDDLPTAQMMTKLLKKDGYGVSHATNGQEALDRLDEVNPRLILLDLMMPTMDGFEFVAHIKKLSKWENVPIVVLTAKTMTEQDIEQLNGRVHRIMQKGFYDKDELLKDLDRLLKRHETAIKSS